MNIINKLLSKTKDGFDVQNVEQLLIDQKWLLVNKILETKIYYIFKENHVLERITNGIVSKAKWHFVNDNYIRITSEDDSVAVIKLAFRHEDILTLDINRKSNALAVFINETVSQTTFNSYDDITDYLHKKYIIKAKHIIYNHEYFYIK